MKSLIVLVVTCVILQSTVWATNRYELKLLPTLTKEEYSKFLIDIRNNVMDPKLEYGGTDIPVIAKPTKTPTFIRIDLISPTGTISIALRRRDLYLVAYLAQNERGKFRAHCFRGLINTSELDIIFKEAKGDKNHDRIKYDERYEEIERAAKRKRKEAGLGIDKLIEYMKEVAGEAFLEKNEARFILLAIEMVPEAARFKYIEEHILHHFPKEFEIEDDHIIILENNWSKISKKIKNFAKKGEFSPPYTLKGSHWTVHNAAELKMGLLCYVPDDGLSEMIKIHVVNVVAFLALLALGFVGFKLAKSYMVNKTIKSR